MSLRLLTHHGGGGLHVEVEGSHSMVGMRLGLGTWFCRGRIKAVYTCTYYASTTIPSATGSAGRGCAPPGMAVDCTPRRRTRDTRGTRGWTLLLTEAMCGYGSIIYGIIMDEQGHASRA